MGELRQILRRYFFSFTVLIFVLWFYQVKYLGHQDHWVTQAWIWYSLAGVGLGLIAWDIYQAWRLSQDSQEVARRVQEQRDQRDRKS